MDIAYPSRLITSSGFACMGIFLTRCHHIASAITSFDFLFLRSDEFVEFSRFPFKFVPRYAATLPYPFTPWEIGGITSEFLALLRQNSINFSFSEHNGSPAS